MEEEIKKESNKGMIWIIAVLVLVLLGIAIFSGKKERMIEQPVMTDEIQNIETNLEETNIEASTEVESIEAEIENLETL